MSIDKCALNFLTFLVACFTEDQQIWCYTLATNLKKIQAHQISTNRKFNLGFCRLNDGGTKIKVAKVLKD